MDYDEFDMTVEQDAYDYDEEAEQAMMEGTSPVCFAQRCSFV
jgi:hypothetical protein